MSRGSIDVSAADDSVTVAKKPRLKSSFCRSPNESFSRTFRLISIIPLDYHLEPEHSEDIIEIQAQGEARLKRF